MAQFQITIEEANLPGLFCGDGLKGLVEQVLNQVLTLQVTHALKAEQSERTPERVGYRNGYRDREMQTRIGTITLRVPRTREGEFSPDLWERYQRSEQAFVLALCEMVIQGVSTARCAAHRTALAKWRPSPSSSVEHISANPWFPSSVSR